MSNSKIKVAEMFSGVGGFHLGLTRASKNFEIVWADQYEPDRTNQFAFNIYKNNFPHTNVTNEDISLVNKQAIPNMDLLVGGFPCQDYSVASSGAKGFYGKKGVLWWDIKEVIEAKWPQFIFLENVDRLLTSPGVNSDQPGRDFGMILRTLSDLGYGVSWKMINAADYGFPQRRRRTFIFAFREDTKVKLDAKEVIGKNESEITEFIKSMAPLSNTLKIKTLGKLTKVDLYKYQSLSDFSDNFKLKKAFRRTGLMIDGSVYMADYEPIVREPRTLADIIEPNAENQELYLTPEKKKKFEELKGAFRTTKISRTGYEYKYGMGSIAYPDPLNKPARTMVTSEHTVSRMSHVVEDPGNGRYRVISPQEAELINTFPKDWTKLEGVSNPNRYFTMGNALVVNLVKEIGVEIEKIVKLEVNNSNFSSSKTVEKIEH